MESIYAIDSCNGLSKNGNIPWKSKKDMAFFRTITTNNIVIMGKNTFFSIPSEHRPLKNRLNIVLTNSPHLYETQSNLLFTNNINIYQDILTNQNKYNELYPYLNTDFKIFCIGGKNIYDQFIPISNIIWVTRIKSDYKCDLFLEYNYPTIQFSVEIYEDNSELTILKYTRM